MFAVIDIPVDGFFEFSLVTHTLGHSLHCLKGVATLLQGTVCSVSV